MKTRATENGADIASAGTDSSLVQAVLSTLDAQTAQYGVATQMRLNEARARAIAATRRKLPFWRSRALLGAAFACSAAAAFVLLMQANTQATSAELESAALYEATFGVDIATSASENPAAFFDAPLAQAALDETVFDTTGLDETVVANDLEFYAWLSETTRAERTPANTPAGSGS